MLSGPLSFLMVSDTQMLSKGFGAPSFSSLALIPPLGSRHSQGASNPGKKVQVSESEKYDVAGGILEG